MCIIAAGIIAPVAGADRSKSLDQMSYSQLATLADKAIRNGHIYSSRWGDASQWLKSICYEMVDRAFRPFGTQGWAYMVVNRESGCNPGAINSSSGANGIAQIMPGVWRQWDHYRIRHDLKYAVAVFLRMSNGGRYTGPWS